MREILKHKLKLFMKKKEKLAGLMKRWEKMLDDEEKRKQRERTAVRSKKVFI